MARKLLLSGVTVLTAVGCQRVDPAYRAELDAWHADRLARLQSEEGWLSLVGLHWLSEGEQTVGSAPGSLVALPEGRAAPRLGTLTRRGDAVTLTVESGVRVLVDGQPVAAATLRSDRDGEPSRLEHERLVLSLIARGDRLGIRVKDRDRARQVGAPELPRFAASSRWRVTARWESYDPPRRLAMPTAVGTQEEGDCPGAAVFEVEGVTYRLEPTREADELFFVFGDQTNGDSTYGAGRFLVADAPKDGRVRLDFNRAYNPPCVFTPFATCPLPPRQNRLPIPIEAGERLPVGGSGH